MYAFITGASGGIGKAFSILLAKRGYHLILTGRRYEPLKQLKDLLEQSYSISVIIKIYDLSQETHCFRLYEEIKNYPVAVVINNAGFGITGDFSETDLAEELKMIHTNITAVHIFTKLFANQMKKGFILNVASMAAFHPTPCFASYGAAKSYVYSFSTAMNYELKRQNRNVHITVLCPGLVDTGFYKKGEQPSHRFMISAESCAKCGLQGLFQKKALVIPTFSMKCSYLFSRVAPRPVMNRIQYFIQSGKRSKKPPDRLQ